MFKLIFWIVVGVLALSFFGISLQSIIESPAGQSNFHYVYVLLVDLWNYIYSYLNSGAGTLTKLVS